MRRLAAITLVMGVAATSSCLLDDDDGDGTNYLAPKDIADAYKAAQCTYLVRCGYFPDQGSCLAAEIMVSSSLYTIDPNVEAAIYAGHVIYNGGNVKICIDAIAARTCDRTDQTHRDQPRECDAFFRGTLVGGEACYVDEECVSGRCSGDSSGTCSLGTCIGDTAPVFEPAQIGENCSSLTGCVEGAYCDQLTDMCTALKSSGATCTLDGECAYGLGCKGTTGTRTCAALPAIGQACATDGVCRDDGTYCDFTADMCKQVGLPNAQCTSTSQCSPYYPCNLTTTPGMCKQGPGIGMPCSSSNRCFDAGTYCDFNTSMCAALKADGMPCSSSSECLNDICDLTSGSCTSPMTCF